MKKALTLLLAALIVLSLAACGSAAPAEPAEKEQPVAEVEQVEPETAEEADAPAEEAPEEEAPAEEQTDFSIGETWVVDGQWEVTVTGVQETDYRNEYSDKTPAAVYIVDYVYTNTGYEDEFLDGLFISMEDSIVDADGLMGYSYPGEVTYYATAVPVGATCKAQACIGVDNPGNFVINVSTYDGNDNKQKATFSIDLDAEPVEIDMTTTAVIADDAYAIGETWTVDGQWDITITGVTETSDRNEYSDKEPGAVYIVDYTYTNNGYEDEYSDGLFVSLEDTIVDSAGAMGYGYPGDVTDYAQPVPVGATCNAQECIGVETPGSFQIVINQYDGNDEKQSATFFVEVP